MYYFTERTFIMSKTKTSAAEKAPLKLTADRSEGLLEFLYRSMGKSGKTKSLLEHKCVTVNGVITTKFNYPLSEGDTIEISMKKPEYKGKTIPNLPEIIYEDDKIIVINKPAGLLAVATETEKQETAYHILTEYVKLKNKNNRIFIVHRLDKDTSGILLFAKDEGTKYELQDNWDKLVKFRGYCAVLEGHPEEKSGQLESWLRETNSHFVFSAHTKGEGKYAVTSYDIKRESPCYSLAAISIDTGRKNQIRVHMSEMGCPIAGDKKYGARTNPIHRLALHADKLVIYLPHLEKEMEFRLPVPSKFLFCMKQENDLLKKPKGDNPNG